MQLWKLLWQSGELLMLVKRVNQICDVKEIGRWFILVTFICCGDFIGEGMEKEKWGVNRGVGFGGSSGHQRRIRRTRVVQKVAAGANRTSRAPGGFEGCAVGLRSKADESGRCCREWESGVPELNGSGNGGEGRSSSESPSGRTFIVLFPGCSAQRAVTRECFLLGLKKDTHQSRSFLHYLLSRFFISQHTQPMKAQHFSNQMQTHILNFNLHVKELQCLLSQLSLYSLISTRNSPSPSLNQILRYSNGSINRLAGSLQSPSPLAFTVISLILCFNPLFIFISSLSLYPLFAYISSCTFLILFPSPFPCWLTSSNLSQAIFEKISKLLVTHTHLQTSPSNLN
ncbi:putative signal peptide protein [Puccinia sorghi]|uniref:Putative signal peptide protein n=1 Tax=Puccinia sorghi TaxID=27349 RepID=A0A0L6UNP1_9BASI|nr:putative signal peptide protein [Puccinia sorghi]